MSTCTYIGIDVSPGRPPFTLAALDGERRVAALARGPLAEMLAFAAGQSEAVVAVSAPARGGHGSTGAQQPLPEMDVPPAASGKILRQADQELLARGYTLPRPVSRGGDGPAWMRSAFSLHERLRADGYAAFPAEEPRRWLETLAEACYHSWLGRAPFAANSLEGRIQRQLVLRDLKLPVADAMMFFEEVTRHKLLHGILPTENLHTPGELNALVSAQVAWLAAHHPDRLAAFGDPEEGLVYLIAPQA